jgi:FkbM family methyltransferase
MTRCLRPKYEVLLHAIIGGLFGEQLMPPGSVLDVGANDGEMAAYYACLDSSRVVHALEPSLHMYHALLQASKGGARNVATLRAGVTSKDHALYGTGIVGMTPAQRIARGILVVNSRRSEPGFPLYRVDSLFATDKSALFAGETIGFWHLDVEWHELEALRGAVATIQRDQPIFAAEVHVHWNRTYTHELISFIQDTLGYVIYLVDEICGVRIDCRNLLCVPALRAGSLVKASRTLQAALGSGTMRRISADTIFVHTPRSVQQLFERRKCSGRDLNDVHVRRDRRPGLADPMEVTPEKLKAETDKSYTTPARIRHTEPQLTNTSLVVPPSNLSYFNASLPVWMKEQLQGRPANSEIPRIIWTYWDTGVSEAPALVQHCITSWIIMNPTWKVIILTDASVLKYVHGWTTKTWKEIRMQVYSNAPPAWHTAARGDILRITLMRNYGGVWVDATLFCVLPLDVWLPQAVGTGNFFSFAAPTIKQAKTPESLNVCRGCEPPGKQIFDSGRCRALNERRLRTERPSNSFMASLPQSYVARVMYETFVECMLHTRLVTPTNNYHSMFEQLARTNATFRAAWFEVPEITSRRIVTALPVSGAHMRNPVAKLTSTLKSRIDRLCAPMFKMTYKGVGNRSLFTMDTVQGYLFQRSASSLPAALQLCGPEHVWPCHY